MRDMPRSNQNLMIVEKYHGTLGHDFCLRQEHCCINICTPAEDRVIYWTLTPGVARHMPRPTPLMATGNFTQIVTLNKTIHVRQDEWIARVWS